jgi:hypothetical protein
MYQANTTLEMPITEITQSSGSRRKMSWALMTGAIAVTAFTGTVTVVAMARPPSANAEIQALQAQMLLAEKRHQEAFQKLQLQFLDLTSAITVSDGAVEILDRNLIVHSDIWGYGNVIVGKHHNYDDARNSFVAGEGNTVSGDASSVLGGYDNEASGQYATVSGGDENIASGYSAAVSGGFNNTASGYRASAEGGDYNSVSGNAASVAGGRGNMATGQESSVSGGYENTAGGLASEVSGGEEQTASGQWSVAGGDGQ